MFHQTIKQCLSKSIQLVTAKISEFTYSDNAMTRNRKLPPDKLISFLISQGSSATRNELLDFFDMDPLAPTASALNQQRAKLKPDALESVFHHFNHFSSSYDTEKNKYRFLAADGSTFTYFSRHSFSPPEYFVSEGHSARGFFSMHLNALYDLQTHTYTDALIQPVHQKDEFRAFCDMVDRHVLLPGISVVFTGDRGYCSYNNMAHVMERGQYFLFRTKDIHSKGIVKNFDFPDEESFDIQVNVTLVRSQKKEILIREGYYKRYVDANATFDFIDHGSMDTYDLSFRVVRFPISDGSYECIVTNLPADEFPPERIKLIYHDRWAVEGSFRKLKYTIGLSSFHSCKPEYIKQEIWAKLIAYNITETLVNHTVIKKGETKHEYKVNFSTAAHICRVFLRLATGKDTMDVMTLLQKELIPIRNDRQYPRLQTAHFRKPRYFIYRAA